MGSLGLLNTIGSYLNLALKLKLKKRKEFREMKGVLNAVVHDMNFNELRIALLAIIAFVQSGTFISLKDLEEIIDEAKRS